MNIILKKTFKTKPSGFQVANEKSFSFHGSVSPEMIRFINSKLTQLRLAGTANPLSFSMDKTGHYSAYMNHDFQKYHEEDAIVAILDVMEGLGWQFRFQYDTELNSVKLRGESFTKREMFIFSNGAHTRSNL